MNVVKLCLAFVVFRSISGEVLKFHDDFKFGVSTSAYQIEGSWDADGKGPNIWDTFTHSHPDRIRDHQTGDVAVDSYNHLDEDLQLIKELNVGFYRFSLSWARILPQGFVNNVNSKGVEYYHRLIDGLRGIGVSPVVTIYHWDLPQALQDLGGWANPIVADYFLDYAGFVFGEFGMKVKMWITFNEPKEICVYGYGSHRMAPGINISGIAEYLCGHTVLLAHSRVYHLYNKTYKQEQNGEIGISLHSEWYEMYTYWDLYAHQQKMQFEMGWFANPILKRDYPEAMKRRIENQSKAQKFPRSRLPVFTEEQLDMLEGTLDFLGVNFYTASMITSNNSTTDVSFQTDSGGLVWKNILWSTSASMRLRVTPWAFKKMLNWVKHQYGDIKIYITENGYSDHGELDDRRRVNFYIEYLKALHQAMYIDEVNVEGFFAWTLFDNFEWFSGYTEKFGLYSVDFNGIKRITNEKLSAKFYKNLTKTKIINTNFIPKNSSQREHSFIIEGPIVIVIYFLHNIMHWT